MMADYIDRQAALDALSAHKEVLLYIMDKCGVTEEVNKTLEIICNVPSADAVEVVRCADCKYYQDNNDGYPHEECRWGHDETPNEDDYCSYGERR